MVCAIVHRLHRASRRNRKAYAATPSVSIAPQGGNMGMGVVLRDGSGSGSYAAALLCAATAAFCALAAMRHVLAVLLALQCACLADLSAQQTKRL